ncbi:MAG: minor capsid protein [Oscillospiraceae bacterium]|nr:minor capsid protein [Oscillospiraceae bacterium]
MSYINGEVKAVFDRYTKNGGLTETQALTLLNTKQTAGYRQKLLDRLSGTTDKTARQAIISVLDAPAYAYRIHMLEALANEIYAEAVTVGAFENNALTQRLIDIYEQSYYRRTFDIQQYTGAYYDFSRLSSGRVKAAISEKWNGKNYSERVWDNTEKTAETLRNIAIEGIMTGQSYRTMEQRFLSVLGEDSDSGARFKASRLIRTEVNYISGKATTKAYEEAGIEEYTYLATLDKRTCHDCGDSNRKSCAELDGKHFKVSEAKVGVNKHPMHPFCRCSDCPYIPGRKTVRAARDENGKSIQVPGDMTYSEWWERYVDNSGESGIIALNRKSNNTGMFSDLKIPMQKRAVLRICEKYKIDTKGLTFKIQRSEDMLNIPYYGSTDYDNIGRIDLFPLAFTDEEQLVRSILHEKCHVEQLKKYGKEYVQKNIYEMEKQAYKYEEYQYKILKKEVGS